MKDKLILKTLNQSTCKKFYHNGNEVEHCPKKILNAEFEETEPMREGKYFETLFLGGSAKGDAVYDLPRKQLTKKQKEQNIINEIEGKPLIKGDKRIVQERIDRQVEIGRKVAAKYNIAIHPGINTQVRVRKEFELDPNVILEGEIDLFPTSILSQKFNRYLLAMIDLKLTGDIDSTWGKYCYGDPDNLDPLQLIYYQYLVRDLNFDLNPHLREIITPSTARMINEDLRSYLWIFNSGSDNLRNKFITVEYTPTNKAYMFEVVRKTLSIIVKYNEEGWLPVPSSENCKKCSLSKECKHNHYGV